MPGRREQLYQRLATYCRPLPFVLGGATFLLCFFWALNFAMDWSLQTGNVFLQISIPTRLIVFEGVKLLFWILSGIGLVTLVTFGTLGRRAALRAREAGTNPFWMPRFRFYPVTFLLGLFLTYFGVVFFFNASVSADDTPAGFVAFVYLNYAGIVRRGVISIIGLLVTVVGLWLTLGLAFKPGLGERRPVQRPVPAPAPYAALPMEPARQPAPRPLPVASSPAPPRPATAPRPATTAPRPITRSAAPTARRTRAPSAGRTS